MPFCNSKSHRVQSKVNETQAETFTVTGLRTWFSQFLSSWDAYSFDKEWEFELWKDISDLNSPAPPSPLFSPVVAHQNDPRPHSILWCTIYSGREFVVKKTSPSSASPWLKSQTLLKEKVLDTIQGLDMLHFQMEHFQTLHTLFFSNKDERTNNFKALINESCTSVISRRVPMSTTPYFKPWLPVHGNPSLDFPKPQESTYTSKPISANHWPTKGMCPCNIASLKKKYMRPRNKYSQKIRLHSNSSTLRSGTIFYQQLSLCSKVSNYRRSSSNPSIFTMAGTSCKLFVMINSPRAQIHWKVSSSTNIHIHVHSPWQTWYKLNQIIPWRKSLFVNQW